MGAHLPDERDREKALDRLGEVVRVVETGEVSEPMCLTRRARLLATLRSSRRHSSAIGAWGGTGALVAAAVALAVFLHHGVVAWSAENAVTSEDGYVGTARADATATLRFASGATLELAGGSRGRVVDASASGARVV